MVQLRDYSTKIIKKLQPNNIYKIRFSSRYNIPPNHHQLSVGALSDLEVDGRIDFIVGCARSRVADCSLAISSGAKHSPSARFFRDDGDVSRR